MNTGNNLLYLVLSLMLSFLALSGFLSELSLRGVRIERRLPREVFAGLDNRVTLRLRNTQARGTAYALVIEDLLAPPPGKGSRRAGRKARPPAGRCFVLRAPPGAAETRAYPWRPERRGLAQFEGFRVSTRFPFALFVKSLEIEAPTEVLVYPGLEPVRPSPRAGAVRDRGETARGSGRDGAQVTGLRSFERGDSARRIHWRSSLRRGELLVGEVEDESDAEVEVLLRTRASARAASARTGEEIITERFEERVRWAASEVVAHTEAGLRVALRTDSEHIPAEAGAVHRARLLSFLATVALEREDPEAAPVEEARE